MKKESLLWKSDKWRYCVPAATGIILLILNHSFPSSSCPPRLFHTLYGTNWYLILSIIIVGEIILIITITKIYYSTVVQQQRTKKNIFFLHLFNSLGGDARRHVDPTVQAKTNDRTQRQGIHLIGNI